MNVKRFFAPTAREALRKVKGDLGADAIVLSNRGVEGGVEIMALPADALNVVNRAAAPAAPPAPQPAAQPGPRPQVRSGRDADADFTVSLSSRGQQRVAEKNWRPFVAPQVDAKPVAQPAPAVKQPVAVVTDTSAEPQRRDKAPRPSRVDETKQSAPDERVMKELQSIRGMIEQQLAGFAWGEMSRTAPAKSLLMSELLDAGFSAHLARRLLDELPAEASATEARNLVRTALNRDLLTLGNDADIIDEGGVYALVGPTGVGKTTTTAKLAARCVVRHGADKLALLTTDSYRIGAHEQLRIYGRILGVSVHAVRDAADLRQTLKELRNKHMVLIDTVGMSQRDRMVAEQASMLLNAGDVRRLLLLSATSRGDTLDDVVNAYDGPDLAGCIVTKVDEGTSLAPALDVLIRHRLECFYIANGQRVPEDLHLPNRTYLLHRALKALDENSPHRLRGDEAGLLLAARAAAERNAVHGVALGGHRG